MEWAQIVILIVGFVLIPRLCAFPPIGLGSNHFFTGSKYTNDLLFYLGLWVALSSFALALFILKFDRGFSTVYVHLCATIVIFLVYWIGLVYWLNGAHYYVVNGLNYMMVDLHPPHEVEPLYTLSVIGFFYFFLTPFPYVIIPGSLALLRQSTTCRDGLVCIIILTSGFAVYWLAMPEYMAWFMD